jgi:hypothetical protein
MATQDKRRGVVDLMLAPSYCDSFSLPAYLASQVQRA